MARRSRQARNRQRSYWLIASMSLLVVVAVIAGTLWWWTHQKPPLDANTLCPSSGPLGHQVLLIDTTDPLNDAQKAAFDLILTRLAEKETPPGYLVSVFVLGDQFKTDAKPLVELCNPGDAQGHSQFTENLKQIQRRYRDRFLQPLFAQTAQMLRTEPAKESPILEMLQMVSLNAIAKRDVDGPRRLIVLSDLLQNSKPLSMYRDVPSYDDFAKSDYARKTRISFEGVEVEVWLLQNASGEKQKRLSEFWQRYFLDNGAVGFKLEPLPG
jgi:hypothetical protein